MTLPTPITSAVAGAKSAFNVKTVVLMLVLTVIVTLLMSYILKNEIIIYDNAGNITGKGEIKNSLKFLKKK